MIETGKAIPKSVLNMPLALSGGAGAKLADFAGRWLVLYFYPKDSTPGCTTEGLDFNALLPKFRKLDADVLGVSRDSLKSHDKFREKESLPFHLLSDPEEKLCGLFDVIREKSLYGRKYMGIERSTFLIGPDGLLVQEWRGLKVPGHVDEVLKTVKSLKALKKAA